MKKYSLLAVSLIILLSGCGPSTSLTKTWTDPSVTESGFKPFNKVLVIAKIKDETGNRIAEDRICAQFKRGNATPSYLYLQTKDTVQSDVDARLQKDGYDGLVTMRVTDVDQSVSMQGGGGYYGGGYGYGRYYGGFYNAPTYSVDKSYLVETCIYSLTNGKLLWSGTTSTFNPANLDEMLDGIISSVKNQLVKQGLMAPPGQ